MASRSRTVIISLAVSISSLTCLYAYSWIVSPRDARIGDIGQDDIGAFVRIRGHVRSVATVGSGGIRLDLLDYEDLSSITAYVPSKVFLSLEFRASIRPGVFMEMAGEVQEFNGDVEVSVSEGRMIRLLEEAEGNRLGLGTLARNPETFSGISVTVRGRVGSLDSVVDWGKLLAVAGPDRMWVDGGRGGGFGGRVDIFGEVHRNEARDRYEIKVAGVNDSVSPHGKPPPDGYQVIALGVLAGNPESWAGRRVAVVNVSVLAGEVLGTSLELSDFEEGDYFYITCMIFGWDWTTDGRGVESGTVLELVGTWEYYQANAQWQVTSDTFTLRVLP